MSASTKPKTKTQRFRDLVDQAIDNSPYKDSNDKLHHIYTIGLLRELLTYAGQDMMEVHERLHYLAERDNTK